MFPIDKWAVRATQTPWDTFVCGLLRVGIVPLSVTNETKFKNECEIKTAFQNIVLDLQYLG